VLEVNGDVDIRGSAPVFNTKELLQEIYHDVKILGPQVKSLVDADLPRRVADLEVGLAHVVEREAAARALDAERELRYQQRYESQTQGIGTAMVAQEKAVAAALAALDKQSSVEGMFMDRRLSRTEPLGEELSRMAGGSAAVQNGWKYVIAVGTILMGIAGLFIAFAK
jgi:hypothetical protein